MSDRLRARLAELMRGRSLRTVSHQTVAASELPASELPASELPGSELPGRQAVPLDEMLTGYELSAECGRVFAHDWVRDSSDEGYLRLLSDIWEAAQRLTLVPAEEIDPAYAAIRDCGLEQVAFLDLETGGLAGQPIFLAGILRLQRRSVSIRQLLVRSYEEEAALIELVKRELEGVPVVVTYNGKSFDLPMLADRARYHGMVFDYQGLHLDLLHPARRRYRDRYPNCRLVTLEWFVCHRRRMGDVPGSEIPGHFHRFMRNGDPTPLIPILHHNVLDLVTLAELLGHLAPHPPGPRFVPDWDTIQAQIAGFGGAAELEVGG